MKDKEENIRRIVDELHQLPEPYLENVYEIVRTLRANLPSPEDQSSAPPESPPFVDEIERVREQSRDVPGRREDQHFT